MKQHLRRLITHPLFSGSSIMIIGSNSASALNYLYHLIAGRLLGPSLYGELASLISIIGLLGIIPSAVSLVIVKQVSSTKSKPEINSLISWFKEKMFMISLIFALIILISSSFISSFLHISRVSYLFLISLSFFFSLQSGFNRSILQGLLKFKEMVVSILVENGAKLLSTMFLIILGLAVNGAMMSLIFASAIGLYLTNYYLKVKKGKIVKVSPNIKSMIILTIPVLIQSVSTTSIYSSDVVLVKHFFSAHDAGIYASLSTLGKIIFFGAGPISAVMFPLVAKRNSKGESYKNIVIYSFIATALFAITTCFIYFIIPEFAINLLFGPAYLESSKLLIWFGIFMSLFTLSFLLINFGISLGKNKIVILPLIGALLQIILISYYHQTLYSVVLISTGVTALLLLSLLIYSSYDK